MPPHGSGVRVLAFALLGGAGLAVALASPAHAVDPVYVSGDTAAPVAVSVAVVPGDVDVSAEAATVVVTARVTDTGTGVTGVTVRLNGGEPVALSPLAGDARNGDWSGTATIPRATPHGLVTADVEARDGAGNVGTLSEHVARAADSAPAAPATVTATARQGAIDVTWTEPVANGGSPVEGYVVTAGDAEARVGADAREATLDGLTDGARYVVRVAAVNTVGTGLAASADAIVGTVPAGTPGAPQSVVATALDGAADVGWTPPASDGGSPVTGYEIRATGADAVVPVRVPAGVTTARVDGLVNGVPYDVTVTALSELGTGLPATTAVTARTAPAAPVVGATTPGDRSATVRWAAPPSDGGDAIHSYVVTAHPTGARYVLPGTARGALVGGLVNGAAVTFTVDARNDAGTSAPSAPSAVTTPRQPVVLTVLTRPGTAVTYGAGSHATARLTSLIGTPIPGRPVELQAQLKPSTTWTTVYTGVTDATGFVRLRTMLPASAGLRLRHAAGAYTSAHAWLATVTVAQRVTATPSTTVLRAGSTLTVTGTVAPNHPVGSRMTLQKYTPNGWVNLADGAMTTTSTYRIAWRPASVATLTVRVVRHADAHHASGVSGSWRQVVSAGTVEYARMVKANPRISLDAIHVSGRIDGATARANIADLAAGRLARRSSYENAPGGYTRVDTRLLRALVRMGQRGRVTVTEIAGGSHSRGSTHYYGRGLDIRAVNGVPVSRGSAYGLAVEACRALGAVRIFHPGYDPFGGHQGHVHCDWS